jgi:hypothetical protein
MPDAVVHVGNIGGSGLVREFYARCGLEIIGPARVPTGAVLGFQSLEELFDNIAARTEFMHIIVNHGSPDGGLHIPFVVGAQHNKTGPMMSGLLKAAKDADFAARAKAKLTPDYQSVKDAAPLMGVRPESVIRLAEKLLKVRQRSVVIHIRGCNIAAKGTDMLKAYKDAMNAAMVVGPTCRMFYLRIRPHKPSKKSSMSQLNGQNPITAKTRRRFFSAATAGPSGSALTAAGPLIVDVRDIDGHANVDTESFMDAPAQATAWGEAINGAWRQAPAGTGNDQFVMQVMWDNDESSYHCGLDMSYRMKLAYA